MHTKAIKITEIHKELDMLPDEKLNEVKDFVDFIYTKFQSKQKSVVKLKGVWAGKGFEKIPDIKMELKSINKELINSILKRKLKGEISG